MYGKQFYVYIMASRVNGAIYVGVTSNLVQRVYHHKEGLTEGHTKKYNIKLLVYYEMHEAAESAIIREKQLKKWTRAMKNDIIAKFNPMWDDLSESLA